MLAADVAPHIGIDLGYDHVRRLRAQSRLAMRAELRQIEHRISMLDAGAARDGGDVDAPRGMGRRAADRLVALVVPDHYEEVWRLLVGERRQNPEIEHHAAVGI